MEPGPAQNKGLEVEAPWQAWLSPQPRESLEDRKTLLHHMPGSRGPSPSLNKLLVVPGSAPAARPGQRRWQQLQEPELPGKGGHEGTPALHTPEQGTPQ